MAQVEQWVIEACQELGLPVESGSDDFFETGGTSLTVIRLIARAEAEFGDDCLPPDDMYEHSSLGEIAAVIVCSIPAAAGGEPTPTVPAGG